LGEGIKSSSIAVIEKTHSRSLSAADCSCFYAVDCRLSVLNNKSTSVTIYRLIDRAVRHKTSLHVLFPELRPTLPNRPDKIPI